MRLLFYVCLFVVLVGLVSEVRSGFVNTPDLDPTDSESSEEDIDLDEEDIDLDEITNKDELLEEIEKKREEIKSERLRQSVGWMQVRVLEMVDYNLTSPLEEGAAPTPGTHDFSGPTQLGISETKRSILQNAIDSAHSRREQFGENTEDFTKQDWTVDTNDGILGAFIEIIGFEWAQSGRDSTPLMLERKIDANSYSFTDFMQFDLDDSTLPWAMNPDTGYWPLLENLYGVQEQGLMCIKKHVGPTSVPLIGYALENMIDENDETCAPPQALEVLIRLPVSRSNPSEAIYFLMVGAVVHKYSIHKPEQDGKDLYEEFCFNYPLLLTSHSKDLTRETAFDENVAHVCNEQFCRDYCCVCGSMCAGNELIQSYCAKPICEAVPWQAECFTKTLFAPVP